jgi:hypothetical protein
VSAPATHNPDAKAEQREVYQQLVRELMHDCGMNEATARRQAWLILNGVPEQR